MGSRPAGRVNGVKTSPGTRGMASFLWGSLNEERVPSDGGVSYRYAIDCARGVSVSLRSFSKLSRRRLEGDRFAVRRALISIDPRFLTLAQLDRPGELFLGHELLQRGEPVLVVA